MFSRFIKGMDIDESKCRLLYFHVNLLILLIFANSNACCFSFLFWIRSSLLSMCLIYQGIVNIKISVTFMQQIFVRLDYDRLYLDKWTWTCIVGTCCITSVLISSLPNYRIRSFLGFIVTTYTPSYSHAYLTIASLCHQIPFITIY